MLKIIALIFALAFLYLAYRYVRFLFKFVLVLSIVVLAVLFSSDITNHLVEVDSYIENGANQNEILISKNNVLVIDANFVLNSNYEIKLYPKSNPDKLIVHESAYVLADSNSMEFNINEIKLVSGTYNLEVYMNDELVHENSFIAIN